MDLIKETLKKEGIVIIPNVLDKKECEAMFNGMWDFFEHITSEWVFPIYRDNPDTWHLFKELEPTNAMMYQAWNVGHAQHLWDIRTNMKIVNIWAELWNVKPTDLLVSFDGLSWLPPFELTKKKIELPRIKYWFHLDQTILKPEFEGLQGWVTGVDVEPGDATLVYYQNSHLMTQELVNTFGIRTKSDWYPLNQKENDFYKSNCNIKEVYCPAGSLVIWDSRLVHCNKGPDINRLNPNFRCISYISYAPKYMANEEIIREKINGFENLLTSNHYSNRSTFFPSITYSYDNYLIDDIITPIKPPIINNIGKSLIGYK
jgi:hypothetical protein